MNIFFFVLCCRRRITTNSMFSRALLRGSRQSSKWGRVIPLGLAGSGLAVASLAEENDRKKTLFSKKEVQEKKSAADGGIWVTYKDGVYDVTNFVAIHPVSFWK